MRKCKEQSSKQNRRTFSNQVREYWHQPAHVHKRVFGISGQTADAISYAFNWYEGVFAPKNGLLLSIAGIPQVTTYNGSYVVLGKGWGTHAPFWLVGQALRYLELKHVRVNDRPHRQIQRLLRRSHSRWERARTKQHLVQRKRRVAVAS